MMDALERLEREADRALWLADPELAAEFGVTELPPPPRPLDSDDTFLKPEADSFVFRLVVAVKAVGAALLAAIARLLQFGRVLKCDLSGLGPPPGMRHGHNVRPRQPTRKPAGPPPQPPPGPYCGPADVRRAEAAPEINPYGRPTAGRQVRG